MASIIGRRITSPVLAAVAVNGSPSITALRLAPVIIPSPLAQVRSINSSATQRLGNQSSGMGSNEDSFDEMLKFGHQLRWQPHPYVKPTADSENTNLCRGSEDTARQVHLREDNHQPTILRQ